MPLRPVGSVLSMRVSMPGGTHPGAGLPDRMRRGNPAGHLVNWKGSAIPVGYLLAGWSLPLVNGAMAATAARTAAFGSCALKCLSRIAATGTCGASRTIHTVRLRWRRATGTTAASGSASLKGLARISATGKIGATPSAQDIAYAVWGAANAIELGFTAGRVMRGMAAVMLGKKTGDTFRDLNDTENQVVGTTTPGGDRTAVTVAP